MEGGGWRFLSLDYVRINQDRAPESQRGTRLCLQLGSPKLMPHQTPQEGLSVSRSRRGWETSQVPKHTPERLEIFAHPPSSLS